MTRRHADYIYRNKHDSLRVRVHRRQSGRWDYDMFYPSGKIATYSEEAGDNFATKREALAEANEQHGPLYAIAVKGNVTDAEWYRKASQPSFKAHSRIRYLKITDIDGARFILRITHESPNFIVGIEVDAEGDEVVPRGIDPEGRSWHQRERKVQRGTIKRTVEMRMNPKYATLEAVPREEIAKKTSAQLDAEIAEALAEGMHR